MSRVGNSDSIARLIARELRSGNRTKEEFFRCAICQRRVRTVIRMNSEKAVQTPVRHKRPDGERCNGWLTEAQGCFE